MGAKTPVRGIEASVYPGWLKVGFWICVVIAVAVVLRRVAALVHPAQAGVIGSSPTAALDAVFARAASLEAPAYLSQSKYYLRTSPRGNGSRNGY